MELFNQLQDFLTKGKIIMTKFTKRLTAAAMAAVMATGMAIPASASTNATSGSWSVHYYRYDMDLSDDVYVTYDGEGFEAEITNFSGGSYNAAEITCGNTLITTLSNDDASYTISSDRIEPTAGSVCFTVTLKYTISSADDFVLNEGTISMASIG